MKDIFVNPVMAFLGWAIFVGSLVLVISLLVQAIKNRICVLRERIKLRKRFDGPPLAKCYCVECKCWTMRREATKDDHASGYCSNLDRYTPDYGLCYEGYKKDSKDILRDRDREKENNND